ncbi:hypothetical protein evm_000272 [Chilo suppressalis]|nr:hypothetical protein evm_000272 [Chilo suppressalis]
MVVLWLIMVLISSCSAMPELNMSSTQKNIFDEVSWVLKLMLLKENSLDEDPRLVGVEAQVLPEASSDQPSRRQAELAPTEDTDMKLKLFRLMYESVRDSDLKVKRAELINTYYVNSTSFEVGYLMGDITDKYNIMTDIAMTLKRLYEEWKPIEHINAYEQIANQAIELNHLMEIVRSVHNKHPIHETPDKNKP